MHTLATVMEASTSVAPGGSAGAIYSTGSPGYSNHDAIYAAIFE